MTLQDIVAGGQAVPLALIGGDEQLARELQQVLARLGVLDPPPDGRFGPASQWALSRFLRKIGAASTSALDSGIARILRDAGPDTLFPVHDTDTLAGRVVRGMRAADHWICRDPEGVNIVYIEGMNPDGNVNEDAPNVFNDLRLALRINKAGNPVIDDAWEATTEPGSYYTLIKKLDPNGAARVAFGQYKAWSVGMHNGGKSSAHEALVQTASIRVHRDLDQNFQRTGDPEFEGVFGINQHWGFDQAKSDIGHASAGCLVGRTKAGHRAFMAICKADPRYVANNSYRFLATVLAADQVVTA